MGDVDRERRDEGGQQSRGGGSAGGGGGGDAAGAQGGSSGGGRRGMRTHPIEWATAMVGLALVLGALGFLLYEAITEPPAPPEISVDVDSVVATPYGYVVQFRATNRGQTTAAGVIVEGQLKRDTATVAKSQVTLDYVPSEATRKGGLFFSEDPRRYRLDLRALGYDIP